MWGLRGIGKLLTFEYFILQLFLIREYLHVYVQWLLAVVTVCERKLMLISLATIAS